MSSRGGPSTSNIQFEGFLDPWSMAPLTPAEQQVANVLVPQHFGTVCDSPTTAWNRRRVMHEILSQQSMAPQVQTLVPATQNQMPTFYANASTNPTFADTQVLTRHVAFVDLAINDEKARASPTATHQSATLRHQNSHNAKQSNRTVDLNGVAIDVPIISYVSKTDRPEAAKNSSNTASSTQYKDPSPRLMVVNDGRLEGSFDESVPLPTNLAHLQSHAFDIMLTDASFDRTDFTQDASWELEAFLDPDLFPDQKTF